MKKKHILILITLLFTTIFSSCTKLNKEEKFGDITFKVSDKWNCLAETTNSIYYNEDGLRLSVYLELYSTSTKTLDEHVYEKAGKPISTYISDAQVISDEIGDFSGSPTRSLYLRGKINEQPADCYSYGFYYKNKGYTFTFYRQGEFSNNDLNVIRDLKKTVKSVE